jgi:hypothetical protein
VAEDEELESLQEHLEGIHGALRSLAKHLERREGAAVVRSQLQWAASHLSQAVREIQGGHHREPGDGPVDGNGDGPDAVRRGPSMDGGLMDGLRGTTRSITLSEILGFIATLRKTGVLRVSTASESFLVQLSEGHVVYAQADSPPAGQRLGEILLARGALTRAALEREMRERSDPDEILGRRLVARGVVTREDLKIALSFQIQCIFHRLFHARGALFQFDENVTAIRTDDVRLNVTSLLLESARSSDELALRHAG